MCGRKNFDADAGDMSPNPPLPVPPPGSGAKSGLFIVPGLPSTRLRSKHVGPR